VEAEEGLLEQIALYASGDARTAYNVLEIAASTAEGRLTAQNVEDAVQRKMLLYDKGGEEHFNLISALHKSVRSSDADAALYWLARMLEAGEDRMYLARRLVRMSIEDIGLADPRAVELAMACMQTVHFLGVPEGDQALAQLAIYLAVAPKSDAAYQALNEARRLVRSSPAEAVPLHLRNAPTRAMKEWGYGTGYEHAHESPDAIVAMQCLPERLVGTEFYSPTSRGMEARIGERLAAIRKRARELRQATSSPPDPSKP
jgi:putative ATPase